MSALLVEPLADHDLDDCARIEAASFAHAQLDLRAELARPYARLWVARPEAGSPALGFLLAWRLGDELEIQTVATAPEARRRGVGRALVLAAIDEARATGCQRLLLEVRASNQAALGLYRALGFEQDGLRRGYYSDPTEDAVLMSRPAAQQQ